MEEHTGGPRLNADAQDKQPWTYTVGTRQSVQLYGSSRGDGSTMTKER